MRKTYKKSVRFQPFIVLPKKIFMNNWEYCSDLMALNAAW